MEKVLKLYKYIDGSNDTPFPNVEYQAVVSDFRYDVKRMGGAPIITCTVMHTLCLDKLWSENVYAYFNGERFFIKQIPTSSYNNTDSRYKHELELVSERFVLDNVYFYDVVDSSENNDKLVSNSSKFSFFGDINEFASRLNQSLQYSNVDYSVVVDDGISSEAKMVSFQDQFFSGAIQEGYNTYNVPFYFEGKVIHFGYTNNAITHTFKYGQDESLLSIQKQNANYKVVNRVTGVGSADNIPYYYPNGYESKEEVEANGGTWVNPQTNLMPSIYRETLGKERFYEALNNAYQIPGSDEYYEFENPYIEGKPKEHIVNFDYIKPTIKGITNSEGLRIDMFKEFAYDANDNDEVDEEGNYLHPYFFAKLRKFDGEHGFNLFDHAIDEQEMVISMTSGSCGACEWIIGVDETSHKNTVQVNSSGNLVRDDKGNIKFGTPQDRQNDTRNYEVWVALKKDIDTFGVIMPNASKNYRPSTNDTFVILHIDLPKAYILAAEDKLKEELIKYMSLNNSEKFNFSISFSRIFFAENPKILEQLNENARIQIEYDNTNYELYVSSYSYNMSNGSPLPEIKVELSDTLSVQQNALQNAISEVKQDIMSSVGSADFLKQGLRYFLRKDTSDRTRGKLSSDVGFEVGRYVSGASGAIIYKDSSTGQTIGELDKLYVRMKAYFETLVISEVNTISGKQIISPAGSIKCVGVDELENAYRCYFLGEQDGSETSNLFHVNDQAYSQTFNAKEGVNNKISNTYYWRLITSVSSDVVTYKNQKCHYIDLSKTDCDSGSDIPKEGDIINHRGNRTDLDRMNFIEMSSVDAFSPNITLFHGVNSYSLDGKAYVSYGVDKSTNKAFMYVYGDMYVGDRQNTSYMRYTQENGLEISGTLSIGTKLGDTPLKDLISASSPEGYQEFVEKVTQDIEGLQAQIDGSIESYFYQYDPTLGNYPASEWIANGTEKAHLNDTFTNLANGYSWRWSLDGTTYKWVEITDTATTKALALAGQAKDTADGKRRVFVEQPKPPYDKGDLWSRGSEYPLMICVKEKDKNGVYEVSDWDYADNNAKLKEEMQDLVGETKDELNNAIGQAKNEAVNNANAYTDEGKKALQASIDAMESSKANLDDVYTRAQADGKISDSETKAINAAKEQADAAIALSEVTIKAYADGIVDEEEAARIKQAQENLDAAKKYAEEQAQIAINEANDTYGYLARALGTEVDGGLLLTSIIQMRDTDQNIMSGINGLTAKGDKSIATWWGGGMYDMFDYYDWDGAKLVAKKNIQIPSNVPSGVIRMDGTGYLAKGKFWWDNNGKIYADPTVLFLMFDVEDEAKSLSATILSILDKQKEFEDMWLIKKDANGNEYIYSKYHIATQYGMTMYGGATTLNIPSIYNGLPIDGSTIYWENGVLKAKGGTGGGVADSVAWANITGKPTFATVATSGKYSDLSGTPSSLPASDVYSWAKSATKPTYTWSEITSKPTWIGSSKPSYSYSEITGAISTTELQNYLTQNSYLNVTSGDNRYLLLSGGTIKGQLTISKFPSTISFLNAQGIALGHIGYGGVDNPVVYMSDGATNYKLLHSGNIDSYKAGSATKLATARTIWGKSFDGTGNIDGKLLINTSISGDVLSFNDTRTTQGVLTMRFDRNDVDYGGINWFHDGYNGYAYNSTSHINIGHSTGFVSLGLWTSPLLIADIDKKCVGINNTTPEFALDVNGSVHSTYIKSGDAPPIAFPNYINSSSLIYKQWHTFVGYNGKGFIFGQDNTDSSIARLSIYGGDTTMSYLRIENAVEVSNNSENGSAVLRMCMNQTGAKDQNPNIEFMKGMAYIDWHYAGDTSVDYTTRLIEGSKGILTLKGGLIIDNTLSVGDDVEFKKRAFIKNYVTFSDLYAAGGANASTARIGTFDHNEGGIVIQLGKSGTGSNPIKQRFEIINPAWNVSLMSVDRSGNMLVNGGITMYSDQRKKTILNHVELSLKQIAEAPLIEHYYNSDDKKTTHVGSIAQYWASMNDWFCKLDSEGYYTMEIQNAALASAISIARELDRYENNTDKAIKKLKKRIYELEEEIERLKAS